MALLQINSKCEDRMQDEYTIPVCGLLSYRKLRFHTIKTLREDRHAAITSPALRYG